MSGGWNPAVHLYSQARGKLRYDDALATFVPDASPQAIVAAGAANGSSDLSAVLADGHAAGLAAAARSGFAARTAQAAPATAAVSTGPLQALWSVPSRRGAKCFVDWQNDVTVDDIALAAREGYRSVEHLKRYTTLGMGTDQGKTSNIVGLALLAAELGVPIPQVGTTTFRPPYTPVTLGALAGHEAGAHLEPTRHSAMHDWHVAHGARFVNAGLWKRPHSYPRPGESEDDAANREARNVRSNVGMVDVSTLGKIELQGRDVAEFLNRVYINRWDTLAVGRCRYGVMLRDDGMVLDDGTTSRLAATHYLMTTTTVNAVRRHAASRIPAAGRMAGARGIRDVGHRAMGGGGAVGPDVAPGARRARHRSTSPTRHFRFSRSASASSIAGSRAHSGAAVPHELLGRARLRDPRAGHARPRDVGSGHGGRRGVRHHAVRHRGDEHAAHREGTRRRRTRGRRPHDRRRPRHGQARQPREVVHRQAAARARRR